MKLESWHDDTKTNLDGMNLFVGDIQTTAREGIESMDSTLGSTETMSSQIDNVLVTINENVEMLNNSINDIRMINSSMSGIEMATNEINAAMDASSSDAEDLSGMTVQINEYALRSKEYADVIADIDNRLAATTKNMMDALSGGHNALNDEDILGIVERALASHGVWISKLEEIVENMRIQPIQTDGNKCAFGHYYNSVTINNEGIKEMWTSIDDIHLDFHELGDKVLIAVNNKDQDEAKEYLARARERSSELSSVLNQITSILKKAA